MTQSHLIRSLFFAPANRPDLITKFPRFDADCCVIDLEDGTPPADKAAARDTLAASVAGLRKAGLRGLLTVRVNEPASEHYLRDIEAAFAAGADGIVIPKLEEAGSLFPALHWIRHLERTAPLPAPRFIIGGLESIRGVTEAQGLCGAAPALVAVYFGAEDFAAEMGARPKVLFGEDAARGRDLGYEGKICVLPRQVTLANQAYSPSAQDIAYAQRLIAAYATATAAGVGTIDFEGRMIDGPLLKRAQQTVAFGKRVAA